MLRITVWNEHIQELTPEVLDVYPLGISGTLAEFLRQLPDAKVRVATLDQPECGLPPEVLDNTDVLLWWGHVAHDQVPDELARRVADRVLAGMGLIVLHSGHYSKPFRLLMGTTCSLRWRHDDHERLWCLNPGHPIAQGVPPYIDLPQEEMYGEFFDIPTPDELVYGGWFSGGELFRSGCCWYRGAGKVFYFQPGHETNPSYHNPHIQQIIKNAVLWAKPTAWRTTLDCFHTEQTTNQLVAEGVDIPAL